MTKGQVLGPSLGQPQTYALGRFERGEHDQSRGDQPQGAGASGECALELVHGLAAEDDLNGVGARHDLLFQGAHVRHDRSGRDEGDDEEVHRPGESDEPEDVAALEGATAGGQRDLLSSGQSCACGVLGMSHQRPGVAAQASMPSGAIAGVTNDGAASSDTSAASVPISMWPFQAHPSSS